VSAKTRFYHRQPRLGRFVKSHLATLQALPGFWTGRGAMLYCQPITITEHL